MKGRLSTRARFMMILAIAFFGLSIATRFVYFVNTRSLLIQQQVADNNIISKEINHQIIDSVNGEDYIDSMLGNELRLDSIAIENKLPKDYAQITNQQLVQLAKQLGVDDVTLFSPTKNNEDIVGVRSTDPKEISLSTKGWGVWYTALQQLWQYHSTSVPLGVSMPDYWTGPWTDEQYDKNVFDKWGYYYDGTTNYIIDPYVKSTYVSQYEKTEGPAALVSEILKENPSIVDISGFNPQTIISKEGKPVTGADRYVYTQNWSWATVHNHPILFGADNFADDSKDIPAIEKAYKTDETVTFQEKVNGMNVIKTFIPIKLSLSNGRNPWDETYVIGMDTNYDKVIAPMLAQQVREMLYSIPVILLVVLLLSYLLSGYVTRPLKRISSQIELISEGKFQVVEEMNVRRNDEIGKLEGRINQLTQALGEYMSELYERVQKERSFGISYVGILSSGLIHEIRSHIANLRNMSFALPEQDSNTLQGRAIHGIRTTTESMGTIVEQFSDLIKNGRLDPSPCDLSDILSDVVHQLQPLAEEHHVELTLAIEGNGEGNGEGDGDGAGEGDGYAEGDAARGGDGAGYAEGDAARYAASVDKGKFALSVNNLVRNAIESINPNSGNRRVAIVLYRDNENYAHIKIKDSGDGIQMDDWNEVFVPFKSSKSNGFGLGLSIVKFIILASGGTVEVIDSSLDGTTFEICIPLGF